MPCPRGLVADGKLSHGVPCLVMSQGVNTVVLGGSQIYVISRGCMPIKWNSPMQIFFQLYTAFISPCFTVFIIIIISY